MSNINTVDNQNGILTILQSFSGKRKDWDSFEKKFTLEVKQKFGTKIIKGTVKCMPTSSVFSTYTGIDKDELSSMKIYKLNVYLYCTLGHLLENDEDIDIHDDACTSDLDDGSLELAFKILTLKYQKII